MKNTMSISSHVTYVLISQQSVFFLSDLKWYKNMFIYVFTADSEALPNHIFEKLTVFCCFMMSHVNRHLSMFASGCRR